MSDTPDTVSPAAPDSPPGATPASPIAPLRSPQDVVLADGDANAPVDQPPATAMEALDEAGGVFAALVRRQSLVVTAAAVVASLLIGAILIRAQGVDPVYAYKSLLNAALFTPAGLLLTLQNATPLILAGLAVAIPLRVGLFNIGVQGQLLVGGLATAVVAYKATSLPGVLLIPVALIVGVLAGSMWASIAGLLKTQRGVHEVISTIMLNSIAALLIDYLVNNPFKAPGAALPMTPPVAEQAIIQNVGPVPPMFPVALILAVATAWVLRRTTLGFQFETVGANRHAAAYAGIGISKMILLAMFISGALGGLAGATQTLGVMHRYEPGFGSNIGFDGITIALLSRGNPIGTIPAALLVATLRAGAATLQFDTGIQPEIVDLIMAITLLLVSLPILAKLLFRKYAVTGSSLSSSWGA